jgi:hypothetical protein
MPEPSKYGKALNALKQASPAATKEPTPQEKPAPPQPETAAKAGRGGKRSDPDYSPTTFFVRKDTKRKAAQLLLNGVAPDKDLSDIVESLLAKWVSEHLSV